MLKLLVILLFGCSFTTYAAELPSQDKITSGDLQHQLPANQVLSLKADEQDFLVLQKSAMTSYTKGTVVLVPDWSQHAASPKAINFLRNSLIDHGWNTLSMMVPDPVLHIETDSLLLYQQQLQTRMQAVMVQAKSQPGSVLVIAQGSSAAILNTLYQTEQLERPQALVLLHAFLNESLLNEAVALAISKHQVATLDILFQAENPQALVNGPLRTRLVRKYVKEIYRQRILAGSLADNQPWLLKEIVGWLSYLGY